MLSNLKAICERSQATILQDALGVTSLGALLFAALHLPHIL